MNETLANILAEIREYDNTPPPKRAWLDLADRIEAAMVRPARNCDKFTSGPEAVGAYQRRLPPRFLRKAEEYDDIHDFAAWLYAEKKD